MLNTSDNISSSPSTTCRIENYIQCLRSLNTVTPLVKIQIFQLRQLNDEPETASNTIIKMSY